MLIANPIYDVVFKYLMEDTEIAKGFISSIIGEEIVELTLRPQESSSRSSAFDIIIFRLDFHAIIKTPQGAYKKILIELQKSKNLADIMRFRRYLGENYRKADEIGEGSHKETVPLPIIPIYFLGFKLRNIPTPVVKINRQYIDMRTTGVMDVEEEFIEKLSHDSFVIQIPRLSNNVQTALEWLLTVFNQAYATSDKKTLELSPQAVGKNALLSRMVTRLRLAISEPEIIDKILLEEEVENEIKKHIRKNQALEEANKELGEQNKELLEKTKAQEAELAKYKRMLEELQNKEAPPEDKDE